MQRHHDLCIGSRRARFPIWLGTWSRSAPSWSGGGVDLHYLGFLNQMQGTRGGWPIVVEDCWSHQIPKRWKLSGVDDGSGELIMLAVTHVGMREGTTYGDDAVRSWHL